MTQAFHTIGHSNRTLDAFVALLREAAVERVVDVRAFPRSRTNPQFNIDVLPEGLEAAGVSYEHASALGGRRGKSGPVPVGVNDFWTHQSFHNYADYALSGEFHDGLGQLVSEGHRQRCVVMCSEAVWWRCHRRIITDYLIARGEQVLHILGPGKIEEAHFNEGAVIHDDGTITYPAAEA